MRIGIAGFGQMGSMVYEKAIAAGHEVPVVIDPRVDAPEVTARQLDSTLLPLDVIIDFTDPQAVTGNIRRYAGLQVPAVVGTTGWHDRITEMAAVIDEAKSGLIWGSNFSIGMNLFFLLIRSAGQLMDKFPRYDAMVHEYHHRHKRDSPSGTARVIGGLLLDTLRRKDRLVDETLLRGIEPRELHVTSTRGGSNPGEHQVIFDGSDDTIILEHRTRNRAGFAEGALLAAEWIRGRRGFYSVDDLMQSIIGGENH